MYSEMWFIVGEMPANVSCWILISMVWIPVEMNEFIFLTA